MEVRETESRKYAAANKLAKRRRRKIRVAALLVSVTILLVGMIVLLGCTVFFPIRSINITGSTVYDNATVIEASGVKTGDKLFGISEKRIRQNLTVKLPYIKDIQLKRNLFDSIEIQITETTDAYCYYQAGKFYTTDTDNKALAVFDVKPQGITEIIVGELPTITLGRNVEIGEENKKIINQIYGVLDSADIRVDRLDISKTSNITALVEGRYTVKFGTLQNAQEKAEHLKTEIPKFDKQYGPEVTGTIMLDSWTTDYRQSTFRED